MTITKNKKVSQVTYLMVSKKNTESDTVKNGIDAHCPMMLRADKCATACYKSEHSNAPIKPQNAETSTANGSKYNEVNRYKEPSNAKLNLSKANNSNTAQSTQTNALKMKSDGLERERERAKEVDDKLRGKVVDLDKMISKKTRERGVQAAKLEGNHDSLDHLKNRNINFIKLAEDDFAQRTANFRNMRDAMLNNFNQTINIMNERYERRISSQFKLADENREAMTNDQYNATRHLQALLASSGRQH